jgi:hypothetical protein
MKTKKMSDEWRRSSLILIYKNKEDIQNCVNYRGIKLMSLVMKLWEMVIEIRLRIETRVNSQHGNQWKLCLIEYIASMVDLSDNVLWYKLLGN